MERKDYYILFIYIYIDLFKGGWWEGVGVGFLVFFLGDWMDGIDG